MTDPTKRASLGACAGSSSGTRNIQRCSMQATLPPTTCSPCRADHSCHTSSAIKALPQQGYRPILYPKVHQETRHAENHKDRLEKCKPMLFRSLETPPFSPKLGIRAYTQKASLYSDPSEGMDNLHQENVPPAGTPTTSTEL